MTNFNKTDACAILCNLVHSIKDGEHRKIIYTNNSIITDKLNIIEKENLIKLKFYGDSNFVFSDKFQFYDINETTVITLKN